MKHYLKSIQNIFWTGLLVLVLGALLIGCGDISPVVNEATAAATTSLAKTASITPTANSTPVTLTSIPVVTPTVSRVPTTTIGEVFPLLTNLSATTSRVSISGQYTAKDKTGTLYFLYYNLSRQPDSFAGKERIAHYGLPDWEKESVITVSLNIMQDFLQSVSQTPVENAELTTFLPATDNTLSVDIDTPDGSLQFYTASDNKSAVIAFDDNVPWHFKFANRSFLINSPDVSQALSKLKAYLDPGLIEHLSNAD